MKTLPPGTRLGPYEIESFVGAGGMGEVYRGRDSRLDRTVAIKTLSARLRGDPLLMARFDREARAVARLDHPNVCTLHDVGEERGIHFLVMEYLQGETLSDRISKGAIPLRQVLDIAIGIGSGLDRAHRLGIVHRDLKPGNVMLTRDGAKILDFGLARLEPRDAVVPEAASSAATEARDLTQEGTFLGTLQYASPERLQGHDADARSDLFALGAMVFEMTTGVRAFRGDTPAGLIAAILHDEPPPVSRLRPGTPAFFDHIVDRCLAKQADERWQTASDLVREIKWLSEESSRAPEIPTTLRAWYRNPWLAFVLAAALATAIALAALRARPMRAHGVSRFQISLPEGTTYLDIPTEPKPVLSPDGRHLAFVGQSLDGVGRLYLRDLDSLSIRELAGTDGADFPFWSPDGEKLGFSAQGKLQRIELRSGSVQDIAQAFGAASWGPHRVILFESDKVIYGVPETGGPAAPVTTLDPSKGEIVHRYPYFLPDGESFLYLTRSHSEETRGVYAASLDFRRKQRVLPDDSRTDYVSPGYLVFVRQRELMAQGFDSRRWTLEGEARVVARPLAVPDTVRSSAFSASENVLVYRPDESSRARLVWKDRSGKEVGSLGVPDTYSSVALSHDERRVVVDRRDLGSGLYDVWLFDVARGVSARLTSPPGSNLSPVWSPDDSRIAFMTTRTGVTQIYQVSPDGASPPEALVTSGKAVAPTDWSAAGLVYLDWNGELRLLPTGAQEGGAIFEGGFFAKHGRISPDGRFLAYTSDESGDKEVYVRGLGNAAGKWRISSGGGSDPFWRRDGRELFYLGTDRERTLIAVSVSFEPNLDISSPKNLFATHTLAPQYWTGTFATGDGERFLVSEVVAGSWPPPLTVVIGWTGELSPRSR